MHNFHNSFSMPACLVGWLGCFLNLPPLENPTQHKKIWLAALLTLAMLPISQAQILIGQTAGFTGPVGVGVTETTAGAKLYIDSINVKGGVIGQKIELPSMDAKFDLKLAAENARKLIEEKNVDACS